MISADEVKRVYSIHQQSGSDTNPTRCIPLKYLEIT